MELDTDQQKAYECIVERFNNHNSQIIPASCGYGKSRIAANVAKTLNLPTVVICPKTVISMWQNLLTTLNIKVLLICTYGKLLKSDYLTKCGKQFKPTKEWKQLTKKGVFIICDESQNIKNNTSLRHWAFCGLIKVPCKLLHLTAAPIDKRQNWVCLYQNMGIITNTLMSGRYKGAFAYKEYGLGEALAKAKLYNKQLVKNITDVYSFKKKNIPEILAYLWVNVFRELLVIPVVDPVYKYKDVVMKQSRYNLFATLDKEGKSLMYEALTELGNAGIVKDNQVNIDAVRRNFGIVQLATMNTLVRLTIDKLQEPNRKVIICCPFISDQELLIDKLQNYNPLLLNGNIKNRDTIINQFNEPNNDHRCLVMTQNVGGEGISLHDTHSGFPRTMYIVPTHDFLKMVQCAGRIYRRGLKSHTEVFFVYSNDGLIENVLVNTLAKTEIAASILVPGSNREFPGSYEFMIEDDGPQYDVLRQRLNQEKI
jgi:hypothetical protein